MDKYFLVVAGGIGKRLNSDIPKQFIEINKIPILMHTINNVQKFCNDCKIVLVLPQESIITWNKLIEKHNFTIKHEIVKGGKSRFYSVKNGLKKIPQNSLVAIHDGVRPFISSNIISEGFRIASQKINAIPYIHINESVREVNKTTNKIVNRENYCIIQTPQFFNSNDIIKAYNQRYKKIFTDDASVLESNGYKINLFKGDKKNIKITTKEDLVFANFYSKNILL